jgi:hypothetical protein
LKIKAHFIIIVIVNPHHLPPPRLASLDKHKAELLRERRELARLTAKADNERAEADAADARADALRLKLTQQKQLAARQRVRAAAP